MNITPTPTDPVQLTEREMTELIILVKSHTSDGNLIARNALAKLEHERMVVQGKTVHAHARIQR